VYGVDAAALRSDRPLILLRNELGQRWENIGGIDASHARWLQRLAALRSTGSRRQSAAWPRTGMQSSTEPTDAEWGERLTLVAPYLEHLEPLAGEIAYREISRSPYSAMRLLRPWLDAAKIAGWIDDPQLAARRPTYTLLLGIAGHPADAARLEQRIDAAWQSREAGNLAAMLTTDLELRGPARVGWIERSYIADTDRTMPEIEAVLLALSVHGSADAVVPRLRVIAAYASSLRSASRWRASWRPS
jgi:hypothetical protein